MRRTIEKLTLTCKLTQEELLDCVREISTRIATRDTLEAELKSFQTQRKEAIQSHDGRIYELSNLVRSGEQPRSVECAIIYDEANGQKMWYRRDTGEMAKTEPMEMDEYQQELPMEPPLGGKTGTEAESEELPLQDPPGIVPSAEEAVLAQEEEPHAAPKGEF